jgi:hypothetical protein
MGWGVAQLRRLMSWLLLPKPYSVYFICALRKDVACMLVTLLMVGTWTSYQQGRWQQWDPTCPGSWILGPNLEQQETLSEVLLPIVSFTYTQTQPEILNGKFQK